RNQHFADLHLAGLHGAFDFGRLEQRRIGMNRDLQLSASRIGDVFGEKREIFAVRIVRRIDRQQVPFRLDQYRSDHYDRTCTGNNDDQPNKTHDYPPSATTTPKKPTATIPSRYQEIP